MTDHVGKQCVDAIVTAVTGLTTTGTDVYPARIHSVPGAKIPALLVYANDLVIDPSTDALQSDGNRGMLITVSVSVEALVKEVLVATMESTAWTILSEVQTALEADKTLGGLSKDMKLDSVEWDRLGEGDKSILSMRTVWMVLFRIKESAPTVVLA
jgi:hypothetical protein